jgi:hypothetical protein
MLHRFGVGQPGRLPLAALPVGLAVAVHVACRPVHRHLLPEKHRRLAQRHGVDQLQLDAIAGQSLRSSSQPR